MKNIIFILCSLFSSLVIGQSLKLNQDGSCVNAGDLDISGNQITLEATILLTDLNSINGENNIISKHTYYADVNYLLRPSQFIITTSNGIKRVNSYFAYEINKWYHIAATYDGSTLKYYVNGCLMNQTAATGNLTLNNHPTAIGSSIVLSGEQFYGNLDEVRIWNVARTQAQIQNNALNLPNPTTQAGLKLYYKFSNNYTNLQGDATFNGTVVGVPTFNAAEMTTLPTIRPITEGLVAYYPFTGNAQDASGNSNHGTVNGATLTTDRFGVANRAFQFNQNQTITVPDADILDGMASGLTLSLWVKQPPTMLESNFYIAKATHCLNIGDDAYSIRAKPNGQIFVQLGDVNNNDNYETSSKSISDNTWHHLIVVWNKPNSLIYIDGVADLAGTYTPFSAPLDNSPEILAFGHYINGACNTAFSHGETLDDIRIYNRAMTECEVKDLYELERSPLKETSIQEVLTERIHLFPNPAQTTLTIELENQNVLLKRLQILNALNIPVLEKTNSSNPIIDISNLPIGLYFLHIETQDGKQGIQKFVKN